MDHQNLITWPRQNPLQKCHQNQPIITPRVIQLSKIRSPPKHGLIHCFTLAEVIRTKPFSSAVSYTYTVSQKTCHQTSSISSPDIHRFSKILSPTINSVENLQHNDRLSSTILKTFCYAPLGVWQRKKLANRSMFNKDMYEFSCFINSLLSPLLDIISTFIKY